MKYTSKLLIGYILSIFSLSAFPQTIPDGCTPDGILFKNNRLIFNEAKASHRVFLINNKTAGKVVLQHYNPAQAGSMGSAGWTSRLDSNQWSALAMSQSNFQFTCLGFNPPYYKMMDCANAFNVCSFAVKDNVGSFWVLENKNIVEIIQTLKQRKLIE